MWLKLDVGYWHNPTWLNLPWEAPVIFSYLLCEVNLFGGRKKRLSAAHWAPGVVAHVLRLPDVDGVQKAMLALQDAGKVVVDEEGVGVAELTEYQVDPTAAERKARFQERHGTQRSVPNAEERHGTAGTRKRDQKEEKEREEKGGPLALALGGPVHNPLEDLDERQLEAFRALQHIKFRTTTLGPVTADKVVKDVIGLARNLGGDAFPAVASVKQQLSMAAAYLDANPKKAKTPDGLARFLMTWFKNEQNTPHGGGYSRQPWRGGSNEVEPTPRKRVDLTEVVAKLSEGLDRE
jgi:hypothetical protein